MSPLIQKSMGVGLLLALVQASISVGVLRWAWHRKSFYGFWAASTLARFVVFGLTALVVYRYTNLNLAATLISLVISTMVFMILEVHFFLKPNKK